MSGPKSNHYTLQREQLRRALTWHGFGVLGNIGFIHPSFKLTTALSLLANDGLSDLVQQLMPLLYLLWFLPSLAPLT